MAMEHLTQFTTFKKLNDEVLWDLVSFLQKNGIYFEFYDSLPTGNHKNLEKVVELHLIRYSQDYYETVISTDYSAFFRDNLVFYAEYMSDDDMYFDPTRICILIVGKYYKDLVKEIIGG